MQNIETPKYTGTETFCQDSNFITGVKRLNKVVKFQIAVPNDIKTHPIENIVSIVEDIYTREFHLGLSTRD